MSAASLSLIGPFAHSSEGRQEARIDAPSPVLVCILSDKYVTAGISHLRDAPQHIHPVRFGYCDGVRAPVSHKNILEDILHAIHRLLKGLGKLLQNKK